MANNILIGSAILFAILAYDFLQVPIPSQAKEPFKTRLMLYTMKRTNYLKIDFNKFLHGKEYAYKKWYSDARTPYVAKPDRIEDGLQIIDRKFDNVPVRVFEPLDREENGPAVFFIHGGGWVIGSVESYDGFCKDMAKELNMVVVSVEYRLAPEHKYPTGFQDCVDAAAHFIEHADSYDIDPARIAIAGDSAGGNLAAAVTLKLRDIDIDPQPKLQVLIYPMLQCLDFKLPSMMELENDPVIRRDMLPMVCLQYAQGNIKYLEELYDNKHTPKNVKAQFSSYLNHDIITGKKGSTPKPTDGNPDIWDELKDIMLDPYYAPLTADTVEDLPKTLVYTVEKDPLRDDGKLYAHRLKEAGVDVEHFHNKAGFHALNSLSSKELDTIDSRESNSYIRNFIKKNI